MAAAAKPLLVAAADEEHNGVDGPAGRLAARGHRGPATVASAAA